jgi:hypothetical protein
VLFTSLTEDPAATSVSLWVRGVLAGRRAAGAR